MADQLPPVIGLGGPIGSGKDTVADWVVSQHGYVKVGFADALKREVATTFRRTLIAHLKSVGIWASSEDVYQWDTLIRTLLWTRRDDVARALLQEMGTEVRRADDQDYWVVRWHETIRPLRQAGRSIVTPDVRFPNEVFAVRTLGGEYWRIDRPRHLWSGTHSSEESIVEVVPDHVVMNTGSVEQLLQQLEDQYGSPIRLPHS